MAGMVTGTFEAENQAAQAVRKLLRSCVPSEAVRTLTVRPRRFGAASRRSRGEIHLRPQRGGITVAVQTADHVSQHLALRVLREHGARDIGHAAVEPSSLPAKKPSGGLPSTQYPLPL